MLTLKPLQAFFQNYLIAGDSTPLMGNIVDDQRFSAQKRLKIYFDAYRIRLRDILKTDFPKTHTLLGDEAFENACALYLTQYPSEHFSVRYFGQHFHQFLKEEPAYKDLGVLAEMAQFEWLISHTTDAPDLNDPNARILSPQMLAQVPPEDWADLTFSFHPSLISAYFEWDTPKLWQHIEADAPPRAPLKMDAPQRWLFWRKEIKSLFQSCTGAEDILFQSLNSGKSFAESCEDLMYTLSANEIPLVAAQTLYKWVNEGMVIHKL